VLSSEPKMNILHRP